MATDYLALYLDHRSEETETLLKEIWGKLLEQKLTDALFYDGSVRGYHDFRRVILRPGTLPFPVFGFGELAAFTWINSIKDKTGRAHFAVFRNFQGRKKRTPLSRFVYGWLLNLRDHDGYLFNCLYGVTPETLRLAIRAALDCGWVEVGKIPDACYLAQENRRVAGVITRATREILGTGC